MSLWKRITLLILNIIGFGLTFAAPFIIAYFKIFTIVPSHQVINIVWLLVAGIFSLTYFKFFKKRVRDKLAARTTVEELGIQGATNPLIIRAIKAIELVFPLITLGLFMYLVTLIPGKEVLVTSIWLLGFVGAGQVMFGVHDYFKWIWLIDVEAMRRVKVEKRMDKIRTRYEVHTEVEED